MKKQRNLEKSNGRQKLIMALIVIVVVLLIGYFAVYRPLREKAVEAVAEKLLETQMDSDGTMEDAEEILDSMSEEDRDTVEEIVTNHISAGTIADISSYLTSGDTAGLKEYAKSSLTDEELAELKEIYAKYQDEINGYLNQ